MKKRLLSVCLVGVLCFTLTGCGKDFSTVEFNGEKITFEDDMDSIKEKYGNDSTTIPEDDDDAEYMLVTAENEDDNVQLTFYDDTLCEIIINEDNESASINDLKIGSTVEEVASTLDEDEKYIGKNSISIFFYDDNGEQILKLNNSEDELYKYYTMFGICASDDYKDKLSDGKYAISVTTESGEVSQIDLYNIEYIMSEV